MPKAAKNLRTLQYRGKQLSILMDDTRLRESQGALEETVFALYPEASTRFQADYTARFGEKPGITADTAYDTMFLYKIAIEKSGSIDPKRVRAEMLQADFVGASGRIVFDEKGGVVRSPSFYMVKGGKNELLNDCQLVQK